MHKQSLTELSQALNKKTFSSVELTQHYLSRIHQYDKEINCFITVNAEQALEQAKKADEQRAQGNVSPLTGIPLAHKDIFCTKDLLTTAGSKMLANFNSPYDSTLIQHFHEKNAVILGKTNMDEFAMGSSNENSYFGAVTNPWNTKHVPGGSSGGSAAAVAARLAPGATGTDTGGSIRQPAALCGITGIKPTYGSVSRFGMIAFASSLDQAGPMTQNAQDAALMLNVMIGKDAKDSTSVAHPTADFTASLNDSLKGITIGLPEEYFSHHLPTEITEAIDHTRRTLEEAGAQCKTVSLPHTDHAMDCYYILASAECSSNLSRFDGVRYGHRCDNPASVEDLFRRSRTEGFGDEVQRRILTGTYTLSSSCYEAFYHKAQKVRRLIQNDFLTAFDSVDLLLSPTTPTTAFKINEKTQDPLSMYLSDIFTLAVNLAGLPGLSMPCGQHNALPIGAQLIGPHFSESRLLNVAHQFQQQTDWHLAIPPAFQ